MEHDQGLRPQTHPQGTKREKPFTSVLKNDERLLLQHFPVEIWMKIIAAAGGEKMPHIYLSSPYLATLFNPAEVLFAPVLKCVLPYIPDAGGDLKNCRMVCSSWCEAVNSVLQDESPHVDTEVKTYKLPDSHHIRHFSLKLSDSYVDTLKKLKSLVVHLKTDGNPIISRRVEIVTPNSITVTELLLGTKEIFRICGRHIWFCSVVLKKMFRGDFSLLCDVFKLLPNLKALTVKIWLPPYNLPDKMDPFPHYPNLQYVSIPKDNGHVFQEALLKNNSQVKSLVLYEDSFVGDSCHWLNYTNNLEMLAIRCFSTEDFQRLGSDIVNWPLKQLRVKFDSRENPVNWEYIGRCFQIMENKFGYTLQTLTIHFPNVGDLTTDFTLHLPKLTSLTLQLTSCFSLDFLLPMQNSLRYLCIKVKLSTQQLRSTRPPEGTVRFFTVENISVDSNIWELFPKLRKLTFCHSPDTTGNYPKYQKVLKFLRESNRHV